MDGNGRTQFNGDWNNLAPRLGLAYQVNAKTAIRTGFGQLFGPSTLAAQGTVGPYGFRVETPWVTSLDNGLTPFNTLRNPFPGGFRPCREHHRGRSRRSAACWKRRSAIPTHLTHCSITSRCSVSYRGQCLLETAFVGNRGRQLRAAARAATR